MFETLKELIICYQEKAEDGNFLFMGYCLGSYCAYQHFVFILSINRGKSKHQTKQIILTPKKQMSWKQH